MAQGETDNPQVDDLRLMERIESGDEQALAALYDRYSPLVFAVCLRTLRDRPRAEEVLLDVFWELWDQSSRYNPDRASPRTYLMMMTRSRAIDRLRKAGGDPPAAEGNIDALAAGGGGEADDPLAGTVAREEAARVRDAVRGLDADQRRAVELAFFDGLSHRQIAERLRSPLGTVKTRIRQGLIRLREFLRAEGGGDHST